MCGFYGIVSKKFNFSKKNLKEITSSIKHRGPDMHGSINEIIDNKYIYFDHNRLSILDLSNNGTQPYVSEDKNFIMVFNGEIYNFKEIKKVLENKNITFNSNTDTEVLFKSWIYWGDKCLEKLIGMFSFAILDRRTKKISLIRDNFGMKPLYFYKDSDNFYFSSEIICILKIHNKKFEVNLDRTFDYLIKGNCDDTDETFFKNIYQLRPGEILSLDINKNLFKKKMWWKPKSNLYKNINFEDAKIKIRESFFESIRIHLRSDVKIGIALSGGLDSSAIACSINHLYPNNKINLISLISKDKIFNENPFIKEVENSIGIKSTKIYESKINYENEIDKIIKAQGEPFIDQTVLSEYVLFKKAKEQNIKVLIMGHGGDEVFGGYDGFPLTILNTYLSNFQLLKFFKFSYHWIKNKSYSLPILVSKIKNVFFKQKDVPKWINRKFSFDIKNLKKKNEKKHLFKKTKKLANTQLKHILYRNLPAMLRFADRSSMKNSIECRLPILNDDLLSIFLNLNQKFIVSDKAVSKYIFREALSDILPKKILNRENKIGYNLPNTKIITKLLKTTKLENNLDLFDNYELKKFLFDNSTNNSILLQKWRIINFIKWKKIFKEYLF